MAAFSVHEFVCAPPQEVTRRFKPSSNTKLETVDSELKFLQYKHIKTLVRFAMHGLEQSIVWLSSETEDSVRGYAEQAQALLKVQSQYIVFLHSEIVRRRKQAAMQVLGMSEKEATGKDSNEATCLFGLRDLARMEQTVKFRKDVADLSNKLGPKKPKPFKRINNRLKLKQTRDGSETGERTGTDRQTEKEESSEKSTKSPTSTPATKKGNARGKGK